MYDVADGNYVLGAGHLLFKQEGSNAWVKLGESKDLTIATEGEEVILESVDSQVAEELAKVLSGITRTIASALGDISQKAFELFFAATTSDIVQGSGTGLSDTFTGVQADSYFQLGEGGTTPPAGAAGWRQVTVTSVDGSVSGVGALLVDVDYKVDTDLGVIRILPDSPNLSPGEDVTVNFDHAAVTYKSTRTGSTAASLNGAFKFVSNNTVGKDYVLEIRSGTVAADGDMLLKSRDTFMEVPISISVTQPGNNEPAIEQIFREQVAP